MKVKIDFFISAIIYFPISGFEQDLF